MSISDKIKKIFLPQTPERTVKDFRAYECKICGKVIEPIIVNTTWHGYDVVISAKTLMKLHLLREHGKKSLKKKYVRKIGGYCK